MKSNKIKKYSFFVCMMFFLASCAPKVTFYVTKPAELKLEGVESVVLGNFDDILEEDIHVPGSDKALISRKKAALKPELAKFVSNEKAADLLKGMIAAGLSSSGQYRVLTNVDYNMAGISVGSEKTAVVGAKVKYCEFAAENFEKNFYLLLATKGGLKLKEKLLLEGMKRAAAYTAEKKGMGFMVNAPYTEKIGAMEAEFSLVRKSDGKKIAPIQKFYGFFIRKWGGKESSSHLVPILRKVILEHYENTELLLAVIESQKENIGKVMLGEYAVSRELPDNSSVPDNSLGVKVYLARQIADKYLSKITRRTVKTDLKIESGDDVAVNFLRGNAYEKAINRLENLKREEKDSFNLGLAYEAIGEYSQALRYYREALDKSPGSKTYRAAVRRVKRD